MTTLNEGYVKSHTGDGICTIEFFHPQSNSLPGTLLRQLAVAFSDAAENEEAKVIVLQSAGEGAFCAGASFDELTAISTEEDGKEFFSGFAYLINAMRKCPKFIIGRIHGKCAGGGVGLAAACDYTIASSKASIKLSELAIGIGPFVVGPVVEQKIGRAAFTQVAIDATSWRSSEWAMNKGLFASVHNEEATLNETVSELATRLGSFNPDAMAAIKKICWQGSEQWDELLLQRAAISGKLVLSDFTKTAIAAFKEKSN